MTAQSDDDSDAAKRKLAAEIEKLQAETRLLRQPWRDPKGVLIPFLGAVIELGSWWQAHVTNKETGQKARTVEEDRNRLQAKVLELEATAEQLRTRLAANVPAGGSVAAEVQAVDTIRRICSRSHSAARRGPQAPGWPARRRHRQQRARRRGPRSMCRLPTRRSGGSGSSTVRLRGNWAMPFPESRSWTPGRPVARRCGSSAIQMRNAGSRSNWSRA